MEDATFRFGMELFSCCVCIVPGIRTPKFVTEVSFCLDVGQSLFENQFLPCRLALSDGLNSDVAIFDKCEGTFDL